MTAGTETPEWTGQQIAYSYGGDLIKLSATIAAAIRAAVAAEREACAKTVELWPRACPRGDCRNATRRSETAAAIRSRP